jgi:hypothetical protein
LVNECFVNFRLGEGWLDSFLLVKVKDYCTLCIVKNTVFDNKLQRVLYLFESLDVAWENIKIVKRDLVVIKSLELDQTPDFRVRGYQIVHFHVNLQQKRQVKHFQTHPR